jgi:hypothetical protein
LVGRAGFEPATNWLKPTALPAELTAQMRREFYWFKQKTQALNEIKYKPTGLS